MTKHDHALDMSTVRTSAASTLASAHACEGCLFAMRTWLLGHMSQLAAIGHHVDERGFAHIGAPDDRKLGVLGRRAVLVLHAAREIDGRLHFGVRRSRQLQLQHWEQLAIVCSCGGCRGGVLLQGLLGWCAVSQWPRW